MWMSLFLLASSTWALQPQTPEHVCSKLQSSDRTACFRFLQDRPHGIDPLAVGVCDRMDKSENILACMETVAQSTYYGRAALTVCELIVNESTAVSCLDAVAFESFQDQAVRVCYHAGAGSGAKMVECARSVANKVYSASDIAACDQPPFGDQTIRCFNERGKDAPEDKPQANQDSHKTSLRSLINTLRSNNWDFSTCIAPQQKVSPEAEKLNADVPDLSKFLPKSSSTQKGQ